MFIPIISFDLESDPFFNFTFKKRGLMMPCQVSDGSVA